MTISISLGAPDDQQVLKMLLDSDAYYAELYPAESNHLLDVSSLLATNVVFFVAHEQETIYGFGALVTMPGYGEIKRMYVDPGSRGLGIGQMILDGITQQAIKLGLPILRLETGVRQPEAISLYTKNGFIQIAPFGGYHSDPLSLFLEKSLTTPSGSGAPDRVSLNGGSSAGQGATGQPYDRGCLPPAEMPNATPWKDEK